MQKTYSLIEKKKVNERSNLKAKDVEPKTFIKRILDANKRARVLKKLIEIKGIDTDFNFADYQADVLDKRNELAHAYSKIVKENGVIINEVLIVDRSNGISVDEYTAKDIIDIKKRILNYDKILNDLKEKL